MRISVLTSQVLLIHQLVLVVDGCECIHWDNPLLDDLLCDTFLLLTNALGALLLEIQILLYCDRVRRSHVCGRLTHVVDSQSLGWWRLLQDQTLILSPTSNSFLRAAESSFSKSILIWALQEILRTSRPRIYSVHLSHASTPLAKIATRVTPRFGHIHQSTRHLGRRSSTPILSFIWIGLKWLAVFSIYLKWSVLESRCCSSSLSLSRRCVQLRMGVLARRATSMGRENTFGQLLHLSSSSLLLVQVSHQDVRHETCFLPGSAARLPLWQRLNAAWLLST